MNFDIFHKGALVSAGRLMNPDEIQEAIHRRNGIPGLLTGWCLCGDTGEAMFDSFIEAGRPEGVRLSGFIGRATGAYATLTHQSQSRQHRFLLPLYEPPVIALLRSLEQQPIQTMLGREGQANATILHDKLPWQHILPLVGMCQQSRRATVEETLTEMAEAIYAISRPETIPSTFEGVALTEVSVSVIAPVEYCRSRISDETVVQGGQK